MKAFMGSVAFSGLYDICLTIYTRKASQVQFVPEPVVPSKNGLCWRCCRCKVRTILPRYFYRENRLPCYKTKKISDRPPNIATSINITRNGIFIASLLLKRSGRGRKNAALFRL
jgi:hypothetical protein